MISGSQAATSALWGQMQQQQAQRAADQAEQRARVLQERAQAAQAEADQAQEGARAIKMESDQASSEAQNARRGLASLESLGQLDQQFGELRANIAAALNPPPSEPAPAPVSFTNAEGQTTGTLINVTA